MPSYVRPPSKEVKHPLEEKVTVKEKLAHWIGAVIFVVAVLGMAAAIVVHFVLTDVDGQQV